MIEIDLMPSRGAERRGGAEEETRGWERRLPLMNHLDPWYLLIVLGWILALLLGGRARSALIDEITETKIELEAAIQDSIRYLREVSKGEALEERSAALLGRLEALERLDRGRYIWAHLIDEIGDAVPPYTWLTGLSAIDDEGDSAFEFELRGRTGNPIVITEFLRSLEASPFIGGVILMRTDRVDQEGEVPIHEFIIRASYREPPSEFLNTQPLFVGMNDATLAR